ncbi:MAG: ABC transporter permease [Candidatus Latescibacteria bacterium]|nr:ABC transporter permease [Candidatus Latescibacterota bacterium]
MSYLRLLWVFFRIGLMNELEYRANFFVQLFQSLLSLAVGLGSLAVIFAHTENLGGWRPAELVALLGVFYLMSGLIGVVIQPSMQRFMEDVREGTLDFTLTKPEDAQILVSLGQVQVWKLLQLLMGLAVLGIALVQIGSDLGPGQAAAFAVALGAGIAIVYSFWLILATFTFWFVKVENILMIFQGVYNAGRWPIGIYPRWLKAGLTFIVPVAFAVTVPSEAILGRLDGAGLAQALGLAAALLLAARLFWRWGIRHYSGASA